MSVPEETLTDEHRAALLGFYGRMLGRRDMESLRLSDRLTVAVGRSTTAGHILSPDGERPCFTQRPIRSGSW